MIRYALACDKGHQFESWFADSAAYDKQAKRKLVTCPVCNSAKVDKAIMAPRVSDAARRSASGSTVPEPAPVAAENTQENSQVAMISPQEQEFRTKLKGENCASTWTPRIPTMSALGFTEEARKMHYGEVEHRSIYGEASASRTPSEMLDEGH